MTRHYRKKTPFKKAEKKLDDIFSLYIRKRDKRCCTPSSQCNGVLQCGHLFTRSDRNTRWDKRFAFGQCSAHNCLHEHYPEIMTSWFIKKYGQELYLEGCKLTRQVKKWTIKELNQSYEKIKKELTDNGRDYS